MGSASLILGYNLLFVCFYERKSDDCFRNDNKKSFLMLKARKK